MVISNKIMTVRPLLHVQRLCMHAIQFKSFALSFPYFKHGTVKKNLWRIHRLDAGAESCCTSLVSTLSLPSNQPLLSVFSISVNGDSLKKEKRKKKLLTLIVQSGLFGCMSYESAGWCRGTTLRTVEGWGGERGWVVKKKSLQSLPVCGSGESRLLLV